MLKNSFRYRHHGKTLVHSTSRYDCFYAVIDDTVKACHITDRAVDDGFNTYKINTKTGIRITFEDQTSCYLDPKLLYHSRQGAQNALESFRHQPKRRDRL